MVRPRKIITMLPLVLLACLWVPPGPREGHAQTSPPRPVEARLVSEVAAVRPGSPFWVALRLRMADGWHVNWMNPGDAGLPPSIRWTLPRGFKAGEIQWPFPQRFGSPPVCMYGYEREVLLLVEITPPASAGRRGRVEIKAHADWLACREACIPGEADLALSLAVTRGEPARDPEWAEAFREARSGLPFASSDWNFTANISPSHFTIHAVAPASGTRMERLEFFPFAQGVIEHAAPQRLTTRGDHYSLEIARAKMGVEVPGRLRGVLVSDRGWNGPDSKKALVIDIPIE